MLLYNLSTKMDQRRKLYIVGGIVVLVSIAFGSWYFFGPVNYLIPGVPYFGIYDGLIDYHNNLVTNALMIMRYYGDERFSPGELVERLPLNTGGLPDDLDRLEEFFVEGEYETERIYLDEGKEIDGIKKFVNKKVPVLVVQKRSPDPKATGNILRLVIGVFDDEKKVVVHDYSYGNNYELSYDQFLDLFKPLERKTLFVVRPSGQLSNQLSRPDDVAPYPDRIEAMDKLGSYYAGTNADLHHQKVEFVAEAKKDNKPELYGEVLEIFQEQFLDERYNLQHPLAIIWSKSAYAQTLQAMGRYDEAIQSIVNEALPLNHDLDKPYDGWVITSGYIKNGKVAYPYLRLGHAYGLKGDFVKAFESFYSGFEIDRSNFKLARGSHTANDIYAVVYQLSLKQNPNFETVLKSNPKYAEALSAFEVIKSKMARKP